MRTLSKSGAALAFASLAMAPASHAAPWENGQIRDRGKDWGPTVSICPPHGRGRPPCVMLADRNRAETKDGEVKVRSAGPITLNGAGAMFPGTVHKNQHQMPGATGAIHLAQPGGASAALMLHMKFSNLLPGAVYKVYLDKDGTTAAGNHSFGPWTQVGQFTGGAAGQGFFSYQATAGSVPSGVHTWAVFVNRADVGATVLISDNFTFVLP